MLFRMDESLFIPNGNCYLADCGGRGECFHAPGLICLRHLAGPGKRPYAGGIRGDPPGYGYAGGGDNGGVGDIGGVAGDGN